MISRPPRGGGTAPRGAGPRGTPTDRGAAAPPPRPATDVPPASPAGPIAMQAAEHPSRTVGVDRLEPGDHAFLGFASDRTRWDILSVFTRLGLDRGEKVALVVDVTHSPDWVAARGAGAPETAQRAVRGGRLVVTNKPRCARGGFDPGRLADGVRRRAETAAA